MNPGFLISRQKLDSMRPRQHYEYVSYGNIYKIINSLLITQGIFHLYFPFNLAVEFRFQPDETIDDLLQYVSELFHSELEISGFRLRSSPIDYWDWKKSGNGRTKTIYGISLVDSGLIPAARLHLCWINDHNSGKYIYVL